MKYDMTNVEGLMCVEDGLSQEKRIVDDCRREEVTSACIYKWAEVILDLYDSEQERPAKQVVAPWFAEHFELNGIQETLEEVPACIRLVCETGNGKLKNRFQKHSVSILRTNAMTVSKV